MQMISRAHTQNAETVKHGKGKGRPGAWISGDVKKGRGGEALLDVGDAVGVEAIPPRRLLEGSRLGSIRWRQHEPEGAVCERR